MKLITDVNIILIDEVIKGAIGFEDGLIAGIYPEGTKLPAATSVFSASNHYLFPGLIDVHVHGRGGADTMDATPEAWQILAKSLAQTGVVAFLATTVAAPIEQLDQVLKTAQQFRSTTAEVLGVHIEGTFINPAKKGAQPLEGIFEEDQALVDHWEAIAPGIVRWMTIAPERLSNDFITRLSDRGVVLSIGHTDATYERTLEALEAGAQHFTHLCNAMPALHHREPGPIAAALESEATGELIADGHHVHPAMVRLIANQLGSRRLVLVSDCMRAGGLKAGEYTLGSHQVFSDGQTARLQDGTLAGSLLALPQAIANLREWTEWELPAILRTVSLTPARILGIDDRLGSITVGKEASFWVANQQLRPVATWIKGQQL